MSDDVIRRKDAIKATWQEPTYTDPLNVLTEVRDRIEAIPSADRPQGEWIGCRHEDSEWLSPMADFYKCSICGKIVNLLQMRSYNFCPNCGSRMSKGADNE